MEELSIYQNILYGIGVLFFLLSVYRYKKYKNLNSWIEIPATLKTVKEDCFTYSYYNTTYKLYFPATSYSYSYKGKKYESSTVSLNLSNIWIPLSNDLVTEKYDQRFWYKWKQGLVIKAFVNPKNPKKSVLINQMSKSLKETNKSLIALGFIVILSSNFLLPWLANYLK